MASKSSKRRRKRRRRPTPVEPTPRENPEASEADAPVASSRRRRGNVDDEPPPAPWGSFPLVELTVFVGIVMLALGLLVVEGERSMILIVTGLLLASIAGLELSIREHFAGYRSHTLLLAAVPAAVVLGILFYAGPDGLPPIGRAAIGLAVFAASAGLLVRVFRDRSGGHSFRLGGFRRR